MVCAIASTPTGAETGWYTAPAMSKTQEAASGAKRRALITIFFTILLDLLGFGMILPLLPFYAQDFGASEVEIGWLFACYSLAQLVFAPILGRLSDRLGRRPVILTSLVGGIGAYLLFAAAGELWVLVVARTLSGIAASNYGIAQAYIADVTTDAERSKGMGMVGAAFGLGFIGGPALGGWLGHWGHVAVPLGAAALSTVNLLLASLWLPESRPREALTETADGHPWLDPRRLGRLVSAEPMALGLMGVFFLATFCFALMEVTLPLFCQAAFGFEHIETSWLFVYLGVVLVIVQGRLVGPLVKRFGERRLIPMGIAVMAAGLLLLPEAHGPGLVLLGTATALLAVGAGIHNPASMGLLSRITSDDEQGRVLGLSRSFGALARVLGPVAGTWLFGALGMGWPFRVGGALMLVTLILALLLLARLPAHHRRLEVSSRDSASTTG